MTGLGSTHVTEESVEQMNANFEWYLSRSSKWSGGLCGISKHSCVVLFYFFDVVPLLSSVFLLTFDSTSAKSKDEEMSTSEISFWSAYPRCFKNRQKDFMPCHLCHVFMSGAPVSRCNECKASVPKFSHDRRTAAPPRVWRRQRRTSHFLFSFPSLLTVVMVSLTSVSPLLYASPNINCQTASLIHTGSDIMKAAVSPPIAWCPPH